MRSLGRVERFAAGAMGPPGKRTFFLEVAGEAEVEWFLLEKQQLAALGAHSLELLRDLGVQPSGPGPALSPAGEPAFRVGEIGIGTDGTDVVVALSPAEAEGDDQPEPVAFTVTAEQLGAMARRALEVVAAGRPLCRFCGLPEDPEGHACPAGNGDLRRR